MRILIAMQLMKLNSRKKMVNADYQMGLNKIPGTVWTIPVIRVRITGWLNIRWKPAKKCVRMTRNAQVSIIVMSITNVISKLNKLRAMDNTMRSKLVNAGSQMVQCSQAIILSMPVETKVTNPNTMLQQGQLNNAKKYAHKTMIAQVSTEVLVVNPKNNAISILYK